MDFGNADDCPFDELGDGGSATTEETPFSLGSTAASLNVVQLPTTSASTQPSIHPVLKEVEQEAIAATSTVTGQQENRRRESPPQPVAPAATAASLQAVASTASLQDNPFAAESGDFVLSNPSSFEVADSPRVENAPTSHPHIEPQIAHPTPSAVISDDKVVPSKKHAVQPRILEHNPFASDEAGDGFDVFGNNNDAGTFDFGGQQQSVMSMPTGAMQQQQQQPQFPNTQQQNSTAIAPVHHHFSSHYQAPSTPSLSGGLVAPAAPAAPPQFPMYGQHVPPSQDATISSVGVSAPPAFPPLPPMFTVPQHTVSAVGAGSSVQSGAHSPLLPPLPVHPMSSTAAMRSGSATSSTSQKLDSPIIPRQSVPTSLGASHFQQPQSYNQPSPVLQQQYASVQAPPPPPTPTPSQYFLPTQQQHQQQPQPQISAAQDQLQHAQHNRSHDPPFTSTSHQQQLPMHHQQQQQQPQQQSSHVSAVRSDSAPTMHQHREQWAHILPADQHPSSAVMPRAESQQFFVPQNTNQFSYQQQSMHQEQQMQMQQQQQQQQPSFSGNRSSSGGTPFVPQQTSTVKPFTPFVPQQPAIQQQLLPPTAQNNNYSGNAFDAGHQQLYTDDSAVAQLLAARKRGVITAFGFGGTLFHVCATDMGKAAIVSRTVQQELRFGNSATPSGKSYADQMAILPGCLTPTTKLDVVVKGLANVTGITPVLTSILQCLCTKSFDWVKGGQSELLRIIQSFSSAGDASVFNPSAPQPWGHAEALQTIQKLLMSGDRPQAVQCAMHYKLYDHALLIAMMCDTKDVYQGVVSAIIKEQLDSRSPLASAYAAFNELPAPEVAPGDPSLLNSWAEHVAMLLANFTRESGEALLQLGDQLAEVDKYSEAHVCYLLAQLSPAGRPGPQAPPKAIQVAEALRSRYLLLGGHYNRTKCRAALIRPESIFLTEVLEYSRQRENEKFVRAQLIPFRAIMAEMYAELGFAPAAEAYLAYLTKLLPSSQPRKDDHATRCVAEVVEWKRKRLSHSKQLAAQQAGGNQGTQKTSGWWPFGGKQQQTAAGTSTKQAQNSTLAAPVATSISRASSANPVASSRPATTSNSPPPAAPQAPTTKPAPASEPSEPEARQPEHKKSGGGWGLTSIFRRSGSQTATQKDVKKDAEKEAKEMIIDTEAPPVFDPVSGRWLFQKSADEEHVDKQIKAGPPKLAAAPPPMMMGVQQQQSPAAGLGGFVGSAPPPGGVTQVQQATFAPPGQVGLAPPPPPPPGAGYATGQRKYVDMFNS